MGYDADGEPLEHASPTANEPAAPPAPEAPTASTREVAATSDNREGHEPATNGGLFTPPSVAAYPSHPVAMPADPDGAGLRPAPEQVEPDLHDVIGGTEGERVTLKAARADHRRYHIDVSTNRIRVWRRDHWARVHEPRGLADGIDQPRAA